MQAKDIMTRTVITASPETPVAEVAAMLLKWGISAVPVVDALGRVLGMVSEGDLLHRPEAGTERRRTWWLELLADRRTLAEEYVKAHGTLAGEIMTRPAITVGEDAALPEIAELLEAKRIKRVPVVAADRLVGIISRANLIQGLAATRGRKPPAVSGDDKSLYRQFHDRLTQQAWANPMLVNAIAAEGTIHLWGFVGSTPERAAVRVLAEELVGPERVSDHLVVMAPWSRAV